MDTRCFWLVAILVAAWVMPAWAAEPVSLLDDPARIPIGVWLQDPRNADKFKALGINCYVGLWKGPTAEQLAALEKAEMPVICSQNTEALKPRWQREILGWLQDDEPDNAQELPGGKGYGPPVLPEKIVERYQAMKAADAKRPVLLNLGQGVAWDEWYGRGVRTNKPEDYPKYAQGGDIVSFDIYPVVHDKKEIAGQLWRVGAGTKRLVKWVDHKKPVWACIECTHIGNPDAKATPEQVRAEVWLALINGATGIDYFVHQFKPKFIEAAVLQDKEMCAAITKINAQVQELAAVLHEGAPKQNVLWNITGADLPALDVMTRQHGGATYVFAVGNSDRKVTGEFALPGANGEVTVLGESRTVPMKDGRWKDEFLGYQVHLYRVGGK